MPFFLRHIILSIALILASVPVASLSAKVVCAESGLNIVQPLPAGDFLITEFFYNPPGLDEEREWVELANMADQSRPIAGYGLADEEQQGGGEGMLRIPAGSEIGAGETIIIAQSATGFRALFGADPNYEVKDSDAAVPDMIADHNWASGEFALANDGDELLLVDDQGRILDALNYGDRVTFFNPGIPAVVSGQSLERAPARCDSDSAADWRPQSAPTLGEILIGGDCAYIPDASPAAVYYRIGEIQGSGDVSPFINQTVSFRGLVTGTLEDRNMAGVVYHTLFVQDVFGKEDGDPDTSDAIAVFLGTKSPAFKEGDLVAVSGQVTEYFGLTEIDDRGLNIELESPAQQLPQAQPLAYPRDSQKVQAYLEAHEGMLVSTTGELPVHGPTHAGCGFAVGATPGAERPIRHDGSDIVSTAILVINNSDVDCSGLPALKSGDLVAGITGPLTYHFEQYKVVQQDPKSLKVQPSPWPELSVPDDLPPGAIAVATLNLDDLLLPASDQATETNDRPTATEIAVKERKLAETISNVLGCPTLIGVQEIESWELLQALADSTADPCGFTYQISHEESADARGIDVALLSDPRRVSVDGIDLHQTCSPIATGILDSNIRCPSGEEPLFSRPPLEVLAQVDEEPLAIIVNHFKSKRGGASETSARRMAQARHVNDIVRQRLADRPQAGIIVLGDFNDYDLSPVWRRLQDGGLLYNPAGLLPERERYSYIFDGVSQLVDGILVSPALVPRVSAVYIYHNNADFPISLAVDDSLASLSFRSSDHDPILLVLDPVATVPATAIATATLFITEAPTPRPEETATTARSAAVPPKADERLSATAVPERLIEDTFMLPLNVVIVGIVITLGSMATFAFIKRRYK